MKITTKGKKKKIHKLLFIITELIILIIIISTFYNPGLLFQLNAESRMQYQLISKILSDYRSYGLSLPLTGMRYDEDDNTMWYFLKTSKLPAYLLNKEMTPQIVNEIRLEVNQYLKENPDYFLNQDHEISISIDVNEKGSILLYNKPDYQVYQNAADSNSFDYLSLIIAEKEYISSTDIKAFSGLKGVQLNKFYTIEDIILLAGIESLDYISIDTIDYEKGEQDDKYKKRIDITQDIVGKAYENRESLRDYRIQQGDGEIVFIKNTFEEEEMTTSADFIDE